MRGRQDPQVTLLAFIDLETRVPSDHPLRVIKKPADQALKALSPDLDRMYADVGHPSIPPERLLKSSLLIALYSVRSERAFCEQLDYNLLFRWFLGMNLIETSFDATTFTKNRERLLKHGVGQALFGEVVLEADRQGLLSEASDRICGKRLKAALPHLVESMEQHDHLDLDPEVRERLLTASAATLDRLLKPVRATVASRHKRRRHLSAGRYTPVRTFADGNLPPPGFLEIDLVAHCGDNMGGSFIYSLVATDVCTGWTEAVPLLAWEQSLVVKGLEAIAKQLPFLVLSIDSDNDSGFINDTLTKYCADQGIEFTRSRAYRKNDQAWVEQKNGAVIRRFPGHERYSGQVAGQTIAHLHGAMRLYVNYFQPSLKLMEETRNGSVVTKHYNSPATPCERVMQHETVGPGTRASLNERRALLDPVALLHSIRETQSALAAIVSLEVRSTPRGESLERFLAKLPNRWRQDEEATLRPKRVRAPRTWRTRKDPFEDVWCDVLRWLQEDPDASAVALLDRLQSTYPDRFGRCHLRTLQRRVQQWRGIMASKLVYPVTSETAWDEHSMPELELIESDPRC